MKVSSQEGFHKGDESAAVKAAAQGLDALAERRAQKRQRKWQEKHLIKRREVS